MISTIKSTTIRTDDLRVIIDNARLAWLGGKSHVRDEDRALYGIDDQLVGQLGEYSLAKYLGNPKAYFQRREEINQNPWQGDGGSDFPGLQVDVKTSLMRRQRNVLKYNLVVRPKERHKHNIYVLALVKEIWVDKPEVILVGWARDDELPDETDQQGVFAGAYRLPATSLHDMRELKDLTTK